MRAGERVGRLIGWGRALLEDPFRDLLHDLAILGSMHCVHAARDWHDHDRTVRRRRGAAGGTTAWLPARTRAIGG